MSVEKGQYFSFSYGGTTIGEITNITLNINGNQIPISSFDSGDFEKFLRGRNNVTMGVSCLYDFEDTGQLAMIDDTLSADSDACVFGKATPGAGDVTFTGTGSTSSVSIEAADESAANISFDLQISGTLTKTVGT